jgi:hypothetical protein
MCMTIATVLLVIVATASCMVSRVDSVGSETDDDGHATRTMVVQLAAGEVEP